jgi:hypothetical protein
LKPANLAVVAAVVLVALFAAADGLRGDARPSVPLERTPAAGRPADRPAPPGPGSRHVQKLMKSDIALHAVRAKRSYCRRDLAALCFKP